MKKIYAILGLAVAISFGANASDLQGKAKSTQLSGFQLEKMSDAVLDMELVSTSGRSAAKQVDKKVSYAQEGMAGVYSLNWYSFKMESLTDGGFEIVVNADGKTGVMQGFTSLVTPVVNIDAEKGTISISPQSFGDGGQWKDSDGKTYDTEIELVHGLWNEDGHGYVLVDDPIVLELDENGFYKCSWRDIFSLQAKIIGYPEDGVFLTFNGDFRGYGIDGQKYPKTLSNEGWIDLGEAEIDNGFIEEGLVYSVPVQQKADEYGVFRLVDPLAGIYSNQIEMGEGELVFDISVPSAPMIRYDGVYNGMMIHEVEPEYGWTEDNPFAYYLSFSTYASSFYYGQDFESDEVFSKEEIGEEFGEDECGSVKGDIITFAGLVESISINMGLYKWQDDNDLYQSKFIITMPEGWRSGVAEIEANDNAPVKYYNLQGMEIKAPEAGQLVIMKKGNKSSKFIAK